MNEQQREPFKLVKHTYMDWVAFWNGLC